MSSRDPIATAFKSALGSEVVSGPGNYSCATSAFSTCAAAALAPPKDRFQGGDDVDAILQGVLRSIYVIAA